MGSKSKKRRKRETLQQLIAVQETESTQLYRKPYEIISPVDPVEGIRFGLELLVDTKHLFVRPSAVREEHAVGAEQENHYDIIDCDTGHIYFAWETDMERSGPGKHRMFTIKVVDFAGRPILQIKKQSNWVEFCLRLLNCCGYYGSTIEVNQPDGYKLRDIIQTYNGWTPKFIVRDEFEKPTMTILGPDAGYCCYNCNLSSSMMIDVEFPILDDEGDKIGSIVRGSPDPMENVGTFSAKFPEDIPVEEKIALLGMIFTLNFMFFERALFSPDVVDTYEEKVHEDEDAYRQANYLKDMDALGLASDGTPRNANHVEGSPKVQVPTSTSNVAQNQKPIKK